jgi:hypothetical protein
MVGLLLVFVVWIIFRPRPVPLVAMYVTHYRAPLDINALAAEDLERFGATYRDYDNVSYFGFEEGRDGTWQRLLDAQLSEVLPGGLLWVCMTRRFRNCWPNEHPATGQL